MNAAGCASVKRIGVSRGGEEREYLRERRVGCYWVHGILRDDLLRLTDLRLRRDQQTEIRGYPFPLPFISPEEECPVLNDRAAQRTAELIIAKRTLRRGIAVKKISRIEQVVAQEFEDRAVELIRARLSDDVNHRAAIPPVFR